MQITEQPHLGGPSTLWEPNQHLMTYAEADGGGATPERSSTCSITHCTLGEAWGLLTQGQAMQV